MTEKEFIALAEKAFNNGFRKCYIKKLNAHLLYKGDIYFNGSGIYRFVCNSNHKHPNLVVPRFEKLGDLTEENLNKYMEKKICK